MNSIILYLHDTVKFSKKLDEIYFNESEYDKYLFVSLNELYSDKSSSAEITKQYKKDIIHNFSKYFYAKI